MNGENKSEIIFVNKVTYKSVLFSFRERALISPA